MGYSFTPLLFWLATLIFLAWSLARAIGLGKLGILSWVQQFLLALPWLVYLGVFLTGNYLSLAILLLLLTLSTLGYAVLGGWLRHKIETGAIAQFSKAIVNEEAISLPNQPSNLSVPESATALISKTELNLIQGIFGIETFYATDTLPQQGGGVVFKGNLRGDPGEAHRRLSQALRDRLGHKYNLFLVQGQNDRPMVFVVPYNAALEVTPLSQKVLSLVLLAVNLLTAAILGGQIQEIDILQTPSKLFLTLPFTLGITAILGCRELAMRWVALKYGVRLTPPFCLPSSQIATFGAFSRIKTPIPGRQALFDLAIAPVLASGTISLLLLILGLELSAQQLGTIEIPTQIFQFSVFVGILAKLILGKAIAVDLISIHPLVILGWLGIMVTALNLMPAGQLDGGRIVQAVYGRKSAGWATLLTLLLLAVAAAINPVALYWAGIILILLRDQERPLLNEISELDSDRDTLGIGALFWMILVILPMTPIVAEKLGIGG